MGPFRLVMVQPLYSMPCSNPVRVDPSLMRRCVIRRRECSFGQAGVLRRACVAVAQR